MVTNNTGGPAFPCEVRNGGVAPDENGINRYLTDPYEGMTLRDYFAAKAMQGIVSVLHHGIRPADVDGMCADAYGIADAMLKARES